MEYTLAITSCNRFDLLERSLKSFMDRCQHRPSRIVIVEDSDQPEPEFVKMYRHIPTTWINNGNRCGQVFSIERLIREIKTEWVFWTEDDFEFTNSEFLRQSLAILEKYPEISLVALRGADDWFHPLVKDSRYPFQIAEPYVRGVWGGWTWNPGLRRLSDMKRFSPISKFAGYENGLAHEAQLSKAYLDAGFKIAVLGDHCRHIGDGRNRTHEKLDIKPLKILIAVKAGHKLNYTKWESEKSPLFDRSTAYHNEPYGLDIHISGPNPRIAAVRETWFRDAAKYPNVTAKFMFGQPDDGRQPLPDEVFLPVIDDYAHLVQKTEAICKWAVEQQYDFVYLCDDDTYVFVDRLVEEPRQHRFDYAGYLHGDICSGGVGYWLSRTAAAEVARNMQQINWAEDVATGQTMRLAGIIPVMLPGHTPGFSNHYVEIDNVPSTTVTLHAVKPEGMRKLYGAEKQPSIALVLIATGKYHQFVKPLLESAKEYFPEHTPFLWTDSQDRFCKNQFHLEHRGWPEATLLRYHAILGQADELSKFDSIFYCDIDMKFVAKIEPEEIISNGITAVTHPGHVEGCGVPERNPKSTAYIPEGSESRYFAGGFVGGSAQSFLEMASVISKQVDIDKFHGITARENDESHLNRFLWMKPPARTLTPSFCYPDIPAPSEFSIKWANLGVKFEPKLLALEKVRCKL